MTPSFAALFYDAFLALAERRGMRERRRALLAATDGSFDYVVSTMVLCTVGDTSERGQWRGMPPVVSPLALGSARG